MPNGHPRIFCKLSNLDPKVAKKREIRRIARKKHHAKNKDNTLYKLKALLRTIAHRCESPKHKSYPWYGAKGIKNELTLSDLCFLWVRDEAWAMDKPSVDRIDRLGNYTLENCQFLPFRDNLSRRVFSGSRNHKQPQARLAL